MDEKEAEARPLMGTIFLVGERAKRARHSQVCSIENRGYIYIYSTCNTCKFCSYNHHNFQIFEWDIMNIILLCLTFTVFIFAVRLIGNRPHFRTIWEELYA